MASGPLVGEAGAGGGDGGSREKQRWSESKVYRRKSHNKKSTVESQPLSSRSLAQEEGNNNDNNNNNNNDNNNNNNNKNNNNNNNTNNNTNNGNNNSSQQQQQQQQVSVRFDEPSDDDSSSLNHRQVSATAAAVQKSREVPGENGSVSADNRVTYNLSSRSKKELRELRRKLVNELDLVRSLMKKLEAKDIQVNGYSKFRVCPNEAVENSGLKRVNSEVASVGQHEPRALAPLSVPVIENNSRQGGAGDLIEKEKRTPKANQYYHNSAFIVGKEKFPPAESNKKAKVNGVKKQGGGAGGGEGAFGFRISKHLNQVFNSCSALLTKLMKHKHGWVFNAPVDVKGLGLYDYYLIIKHPMDLGTVKSKLNSGLYNSPRDFAEDVRLTFHNALRYNPKGQDVHIMAEQLLKIFEDKWAVIESEYNLDFRFEEDRYRRHLPAPISNKASVPPSLTRETRSNLDRSESMTVPVESNSKLTNYAPLGRTPALKKPKAKDPNKRNMTYEEKQKLSTNLQSLPSEKLDMIVQIIKKRNTSLSQHDDEIEVDIDSVDPETLWELDRFVTNYKKSLSKNKRKAEQAQLAREAAEKTAAGVSSDAATVSTTVQTKTDEKMPSSAPVLAEKQGDNESRSSSSSSSSSDSGSSSSDSDSESSSGSEAGHSSRT